MGKALKSELGKADLKLGFERERESLCSEAWMEKVWDGVKFGFRKVWVVLKLGFRVAYGARNPELGF